MNSPYQPHDESPAVRARVPSHVAGGQLSTGVIVVTGSTEFVLDFVRNLPRPSTIVSRIVLPYGVMPQFVQALERNMELYRQRFGPIPVYVPATSSSPSVVQPRPYPMVRPEPSSSTDSSSSDVPQADYDRAQSNATPGTDQTRPKNTSHDMPLSASNPPTAENSANDFGQSIDIHSGAPVSEPVEKVHSVEWNGGARGDQPPPAGNVSRHPNPQEIYDELKMRDELLSGTYANAVMIGHGQYEFSFDFITNFYPQSAVSARVFMAAGHVGRLLESLKASWEQLRPRLGGNGPMA